MERFIQKFKKGGLYGIGARSGMGKTQFCISVTSLLASKGSKVLYMSNAMDEDEFFKRMKTDNLNICNKDRLPKNRQTVFSFLKTNESCLFGYNMGE